VQPDPERLRAVPLFAALPPEDLDRLATMFSVEEVGDAGRRLTPEGAPGYMFYVIAEGTADVFHHDDLVARLGPGDFFGEMAIVGGGRRVADVVATSPMTIYAMFGTAFREMEAAFPELADRIRATVDSRRSADGVEPG
jgi:CRP-like cAMP-binding protein